MTIFHGGCVGCIHNVDNDICTGCRYFDVPRTWDFPDLNPETKHDEDEKAARRKELLQRERLTIAKKSLQYIDEIRYAILDEIALLKKGE